MATLLRLGWTDPRTGIFGAHPQLGGPLDLNDGVTLTLMDGGLELAPPPRELGLAGNVRTQGERATRALYRSNRQVRARLMLGPMATHADLAATVRTLVAWVDAAPAMPLALQWQAPGAASPVYLDVVGAAHSIPADERDWLRLQIEPVELVFSARPGLRGDRVTLSNLVCNPGFEAPSGAGVTVFNDALATLNAYTLQAGSPATLAANVLTLPAGTTLSFGSPAWGAIQQWQLRFQYVAGAGQTFNCYLHWTNGANNLLVQLYTNQLGLFQEIAGVTHQLALVNPTLTTGSWYWLRVTQFPSVAGNPPLLQATLYADSAGSVGAAVASGSVGPVATYDAVTALSGVMALNAAVGGWSVGGAFSNVHTVSLFGPGAWTFTGALGGVTGPCAGAWEQNPANTYGPASGAPVTSFGAARIDLPPAGTVDTVWTTFTGGSPVGSVAVMPIAAGDVVSGSLYVRSSGLASTTIQQLRLQEWDAAGVFLRQTTLQAVTGAQATWIKLSGSVTTGASAAYAALVLEVVETIAGASANGTVWVDSAQVYDQTATGMSSMPYCECRFPQSPAQLLITGLLGDLPSPAMLALGTYQAAFNTGQALSWALGRRGQASVNAQLVGAGVGFQPSNTGGLIPSTSAVLDPTSYGGSYLSTTLNASGFNPRALSAAPSDLLGVYHLLSRAWTAEAGANLPNVATRLVTQQRSQAWFGLSSGADQLGFYAGPWSSPFSAASTWTVADSGQASIPPLPAGALTDLTKNYVTPRSQWSDATAGGGAFRTNWQLLLPVDGSLLLGTVNNPSNGSNLLSSWLWQYADGLLTTRGGPSDGPALTYSTEATALPAPNHGAGGPGNQSSGTINVNSGADPYLTLDPQQAAVAGSGAAPGPLGINQLAGYISDTAGDALPLFAEIVYTPLYLYPR